MRRRHRLRVDTFPFLAVLLCAMGALILILLVMDRRSRLAAAARGRENARLAALEARPEPDGVVGEDDARLEAERKALDDEMRQVQARLAEVARELQREEEGVGNLRLEAKGKQRALRGQEQAYQTARKEAADLKAALTAEDRARHALAAELVQLEGVIRDLKASRKRDAQTYSVIPYKGKHGEQRAPMYIECTRIGHLFHPDRFELIDPSVETLRLEIARRVTRIAEKRRRAGLKDERPYLMMLIRPEGVMRYYQVQSAVRELPVEFGYEFVDADWVLTVPPEVAELAGTAEPTLSKPSPDRPIRIPSFGPGGASGSVGDGTSRRPGRNAGVGSADAGGSGGTGRGRGFGIPGGFGGPSGPVGPFGNAPGGVGWGGRASRAGSPPSNLALLGLGGGGGSGGHGGIGGPAGGWGGNGSASGPGGYFGNGTGSPGGPGGVPGRSGGIFAAGGSGTGGDRAGRAGPFAGGPAGGGSGGPLGDSFGSAGGGAGGRAGSPPSNLALLGIGGSGATGGPGGSLLGGLGGSAMNGDGRGQAMAGLGGRGTGSSSSGAGGSNPSPGLFGTRSNRGGTQGDSSSSVPLPDDGTIRIGRANPDAPTKPLFDPSTPPATSEAVAKAASAIRVPSVLPAAMTGGTGSGSGGSGNGSPGSGSGSPPSGGSPAGSGNASSGGSGTGSGGSDEPAAQGKRRPQREGFHGADSLAPPPRRNRPLLPARIGEAEETTVFIECRAAGVVIHPSGQSIPLAALDQAPAKNALRQAVMEQLAMHKGNPARRQVRFLIHRDAERTFHAAYPALDDIKVDKTRYTLQPGDDVSRLILVD